MIANANQLGAVVAERKVELGANLSAVLRLHETGRTSHAFSRSGVAKLTAEQAAALREGYAGLRARSERPRH